MPSSLIHRPAFTDLPQATGARRPAFVESWILKATEPGAGRALWLRFSLFQSRNGFKNAAEIWAIWSQKSVGPGRDTRKIALKQGFELSAFKWENEGIRIQDSVLSSSFSKGSVSSKGRSLRWNIRMLSTETTGFDSGPEILIKSGILQNRRETLAENLLLEGTVEVDGETIDLKNCTGMIAHSYGKQAPGFWAWSHCNSFNDEKGQPVDFLFEGFTARQKNMGIIPLPRLSSFYFRYQGEEFRFNTLWQSLHARSAPTATAWEFQVERGPVSFRGKLSAEHRDFAGITYEDTDGTLLYATHSCLSDLTVWVYREGKLEATLKCQNGASFELGSRSKNPYVPMLL